MERYNGTVLVIALFSLFILAIVGASLPREQLPEEEEEENSSPENGAPAEPIDIDSDPLSSLSGMQLVFLLFLGITGLIAAAIGYRTISHRRSDEATTELSSPPPTPIEEEITDETLSEVSAAAGRAADRIRTSDLFENEVYRAWWDMTRALSVNGHRTKTAGEFANLAIRAGMDRQDVLELTQLFEEIRYGDRELDAVDERRAVELLARIESVYGADTS